MVDDLVRKLESPANVFYEYAADDGAMLREAAAAIRSLTLPSDLVVVPREPTPEMVEILRSFIGDYTDRPIHGIEKAIRAMLAAHKEG